MRLVQSNADKKSLFAVDFWVGVAGRIAVMADAFAAELP
jgi:hypothetical protein